MEELALPLVCSTVCQLGRDPLPSLLPSALVNVGELVWDRRAGLVPHLLQHLEEQALPHLGSTVKLALDVGVADELILRA